jgi:hypothetical protein
VKGNPKSLEGIISYLTKKHGGNVHEKGIVTITSKSVYDPELQRALKNVADLTSFRLTALSLAILRSPSTFQLTGSARRSVRSASFFFFM